MNKRPSHASSFAVAAGALALSVGLAACAPATGATPTSQSVDAVSIVASTSVYGQIASEIAGDSASVTSIIDSAADDPHSYEASARDRLDVNRADIVIVNGGGYDTFMQPLLTDAADASRVVLDVSELSGLLPGDEAEHEHVDGESHDTETPAETGEAHADEHADESATDDAHAGHGHVDGFNEHLWYNFDTMRHLAEAIEAELALRVPAKADEFAARAATLDTELRALEARAAALAASYDGTPVALTEPVPLYLLEAAGLHNETPEAFSAAIEEGDDVAPRVLQQTLKIVASPVALLAYNQQTASPQTELVRDAAVAASVPVVDFAETLPDETTYISWMNRNIDELTRALEKVPAA